MDTYLEDESNDDKVFMLAGDWSDKQEKSQLYKDIVSLGGRFIESDVWNSSCTHVIAKTFNMTEKLMGAIAAGRWVITKRFIDKSVKNGGWVNPRAYVIDDAVLHHRRKWLNEGSSGAAFHGMKVVFMLDPDQSHKKEVYTRIVKAGDGTVADQAELEIQMNGDIELDEVTHIVVDPSILEDNHPRAKMFKEWMELVEKEGKKVWHVYYRFLTEKLQKPGIAAKEAKFSIFNKIVQIQAKKTREAEASYGNRVKRGENTNQVKNTNNTNGGAPEVVTIDEEDLNEDTPASVEDFTRDVDERISSDENLGGTDLSNERVPDSSNIQIIQTDRPSVDRQTMDEIEMFLEDKSKQKTNKKKLKARKKKFKDTKNVKTDDSQQRFTKKRIRLSNKDQNFDEDSDEDVESKESKSNEKRSKRKSPKEDKGPAPLAVKVLPRRSSRKLSLNLKDISSGEE